MALRWVFLQTPRAANTGSGIFLSPILLFAEWSDTRTASGVAAVFILCNSIAGLLGNIAIVKSLPSDLPIYASLSSALPSAGAYRYGDSGPLD
jgi:uncharacterized membrane protein YfcA